MKLEQLTLISVLIGIISEGLNIPESYKAGLKVSSAMLVLITALSSK
jgi:hypothetical protein